MSRKVRYKRHQIPPGTFVNMVPLIDVLMQLILFLMVMGSWDRSTKIELNLPGSTSRLILDAGANIEIAYLMREGNPKILLNGTAVNSIESLGSALQSMKKDKQVVNLSIEKSVPYQDVIGIMDVVRDSGFLKFALLTLPSP